MERRTNLEELRELRDRLLPLREAVDAVSAAVEAASALSLVIVDTRRPQEGLRLLLGGVHLAACRLAEMADEAGLHELVSDGRTRGVASTFRAGSFVETATALPQRIAELEGSFAELQELVQVPWEDIILDHVRAEVARAGRELVDVDRAIALLAGSASPAVPALEPEGTTGVEAARALVARQAACGKPAEQAAG